MKIDNQDISVFSAYWVGNFADVMTYPSLKEPNANHWAEFNGAEVDLSAPQLKKREFEMIFLLKNAEKYHEWVTFLTQTTTRLWYFKAIEKSYRLRVVGFSSYEWFLQTAEIKVKVCEDTPFLAYTYTPPAQNKGTSSWEIDGVPFSKYGIFVLQQTDFLQEKQDLKPVLEIENRLMNGVKTFAQPLRFEAPKLRIRCFLKAEIPLFFTLYEAFLYDWIKPNPRSLFANGQTFTCYYHSAKVLFFKKKENQLYCEFEMEIKMSG